jgi:hypothetical protein
MKIRTVNAFLESKEAIQKIQGSKRAKKLGELIAIELIYIPFIFFIVNVLYEKEIKNLRIIFVIDCILGESAIYDGKEEDLINPIEIEIPDTNVLPFDQKIIESIQKIGEEETLNTLKKILTRKLKKKSSLKIISKDLIYYPFYVMYFNKNSIYNIEVINAVSGEFNNLKNIKVDIFILYFYWIYSILPSSLNHS